MLQDDRVSHQGQPIALVVAGTIEQAPHAATLVRIAYTSETGTTDVARVQPVLPTQDQNHQGNARPPETRAEIPSGPRVRRGDRRPELVIPAKTTIRSRCTPRSRHGTATA